MQKLPKTLIEVIQYFADNRNCVEFVRNLRWENGPTVCPACGSDHTKELSTRQVWKCYGCKKQFSVKVGTIFEDSPLPLQKWLRAMWLIANAKNGISSYEVHRSIGVTQKTAWFLLHRIREAMREGTIEKLTGTVEADETFVGGVDKNRHADKKRYQKITGERDKTVVFGMVERGGKARAQVVESTKARDLKPAVRNNIENGAVLYTDNLASYDGLQNEFYRATINHGSGEYVRGEVHTNTIEGYWSLFKRCYRGTWTHTSTWHMDRYLDEQAMRYNYRKGTDSDRFRHVVSQVFGRRLTWEELTAANA